MKTGIITLLGNNYGNRLQNYAVQEILKEYGEVYTVRYEKKHLALLKSSRFSKYTPWHIKSAIDSRLLNLYHLSNRRMGTIGRSLFFMIHRKAIKSALNKRNIAFQSFDDKYITYETSLLHLSGDDESDWVKSYDAWVCGSDQIWNPNYPTATRNAFLQFAPKKRRISLSASIGLSDVVSMPSEYSAWINGIDFLSVREERAAEIIYELTGRSAEVFLDPTMIIPLKKWDEMANHANIDLSKKYAVGYFLGIREKEYLKYISSQLMHKQIGYIDLLNGEKPEYLAYSPDQVIAAIREADIVFVDSFHGAVFSILFHKQFVVFKRVEDGQSMNSRLDTLLKKFGMENRIYNANNTAILEEPIDYSVVDRIIEQERNRVKRFLDQAMSEIEKLPKNAPQSSKAINIIRSEQCTGCTACECVCPKKCVSMKQDSEGFVYPKVNMSLCINCGRCSSVCPVINNEGGNKPQTVLAEKNKNEAIRKTSSSGGVFYEIASEIIKNGGIVLGCALDDNMVARHIAVDSIKGLERLKSSKYVQSDMGEIYCKVKKYIVAGRRVLFSGTPCQCAGLRNYLGRDYDNLIVVDVLCHGVPSPKLFADYLEYISKQYGGGKPISVNFRNKQKGWKRLYMEIRFDNGKRHYTYSGYDRYEGMFLNNLSLRPSCYECKFTKAERFGDITLGDFWGIGKKYPEWDDDKGISVVMINTKKGECIWQSVTDKFTGRIESFDLAKEGQRTLYAPTRKNPKRDEFYKIYAEQGCKAALEKYTSVPSASIRTYYAVMRWGLDIVRKILRRGY